MDDGTHECPKDGCEKRLPMHLLACRAHWAMVPRDIQREVYHTWSAGPHDQYVAARRDAIDAMNGRLL